VSEQQKTAGYKVVPVEPTAEMREAGHRAAWQSVPSLFDRDDVANVYRAMLAAAPKPPALTDERILEIAMSDDVSLIEDQGPGVRPRITVHNSIGGVYAFARAIEREILGGGE